MGSSPGTLGSESRLVAYVETLTGALGHADRAIPFRSYCTGLLFPGARKSVEPMAARVEPGRVQAAHQSLHHFVAKAAWLAQISAAVAAGVPKAPVLADAGYGIDTAFRDGITALGLAYIVGIQSQTSLWPPGMEPLPPKPWSGRGRPPSAIRRDADHAPMPAKARAASLPKRAWRRVVWREGSNAVLAGRFAAVRVRPAHRDYNRPTPTPEEWLLVEWPRDEPEPTKYWLSTLPPTVTRRTMVEQAKLRWRIERDYQDLKQELGLGHYEGQGWRGFHHHATLCIAAYGFLIAERAAFPPSAEFWPPSLKASALPDSYRPRGAPDPA